MATELATRIIISARDEAGKILKDITIDIQRMTKASREVSAGLLETYSILQGFSQLKAGLQGVVAITDDYRQATIAIAASLTETADTSKASLKDIYETNLAYAKDTYLRMGQYAAAYGVNVRELGEALQILSVKGIVLANPRDMENLAIIAGRIKMITRGQVSNIQMSQELRAAMSGQSRATDQLAINLRTKLGPEWQKMLATAVQQGTALQFIADNLKGTAQASKDIQKTWSSTYTDIKNTWETTSIPAFATMYEDMVRWAQQLNTYMSKHRDEIIEGVHAIWKDLRTVVEGVASAVRFFAQNAWARDLAAALAIAAVAAKTLAISVAAIGAIGVSISGTWVNLGKAWGQMAAPAFTKQFLAAVGTISVPIIFTAVGGFALGADMVKPGKEDDALYYKKRAGMVKGEWGLQNVATNWTNAMRTLMLTGIPLIWKPEIRRNYEEANEKATKLQKILSNVTEWNNTPLGKGMTAVGLRHFAIPKEYIKWTEEQLRAELEIAERTRDQLYAIWVGTGRELIINTPPTGLKPSMDRPEEQTMTAGQKARALQGFTLTREQMTEQIKAEEEVNRAVAKNLQSEFETARAEIEREYKDLFERLFPTEKFTEVGADFMGLADPENQRRFEALTDWYGMKMGAVAEKETSFFKQLSGQLAALTKTDAENAIVAHEAMIDDLRNKAKGLPEALAIVDQIDAAGRKRIAIQELKMDDDIAQRTRQLAMSGLSFEEWRGKQEIAVLRKKYAGKYDMLKAISRLEDQYTIKADENRKRWTYQMQDQIETLNQIDLITGRALSAWEVQRNRTAREIELMRWNARGDKAQLDWIARYERAVNKRYGEGFKPGFERGMTEWVEENTKTTFEYGVTVAKAAAQGMSNAFENLFFDVFMGRMQQLSDYLTSFLESISRAMAQMLAQQAAIGIIGSVYPAAAGAQSYNSPFWGGEMRASGGPVIGGTSYLVGERGPELFTPSRSGMITPNGATVGAGNVKVIVNNNTGTRSTASVTPPKWNGREWVIGIVLDAYARNSNGFRTALGGSA